MHQEQKSHGIRHARGQGKYHQSGYFGLQPPVDVDEEREQPHRESDQRCAVPTEAMKLSRMFESASSGQAQEPTLAKYSSAGSLDKRVHEQ